MIRVDANILFLQSESKLAVLYRLQLMMVVEVWPAPQTAVDDMW